MALDSKRLALGLAINFSNRKEHKRESRILTLRGERGDQRQLENHNNIFQRRDGTSSRSSSGHPLCFLQKLPPEGTELLPLPPEEHSLSNERLSIANLLRRV